MDGLRLEGDEEGSDDGIIDKELVEVDGLYDGDCDGSIEGLVDGNFDGL